MRPIEVCTAARNLIKKFESLKLTAYRDRKRNGILTIGWGHTSPDVTEGLTITPEQAELLFNQDVIATSHQVAAVIHDDVILTENQLSALVSLVFNIGIGHFESSHLLAFINEGNMKAAANQFLRWDHEDGVVIPGLLNRRRIERIIFLRRNPITVRCEIPHH